MLLFMLLCGKLLCNLAFPALMSCVIFMWVGGALGMMKKELNILEQVPNFTKAYISYESVNPLNAELNPICHLLALLGAHPILHISRIRVKSVFCPQNISERDEQNVLNLELALFRLGYKASTRQLSVRYFFG
jgi:hypothetical protein